MNDSNLCPEVSESGFHPEVVVAQAANPTPPEASHLCTSLFLPPSLSPLKFHHSSMQARSKGIKLDSSPLTSPSPTKSPAPPRSLSPSCSAPLPLFPAPPLALRWTYLPPDWSPPPRGTALFKYGSDQATPMLEVFQQFSCLLSESCSVMSDSLQPHGL